MTGSRSKGEEGVILLSRIPSPVGDLFIAGIHDTVYYISFDRKESKDEMQSFLQKYFPKHKTADDDGKHRKVHYELTRYFAGRLRRFSVKTHLLGTDFQLQVWTALRTIAYGRTASYKEIAELIGNPGGMRAVGGAVGRNPIPLIVPCHRIIGENGSLVGFGGGINRKKKLLHLEGALLV